MWVMMSIWVITRTAATAVSQVGSQPGGTLRDLTTHLGGGTQSAGFILLTGCLPAGLQSEKGSQDLSAAQLAQSLQGGHCPHSNPLPIPT